MTKFSLTHDQHPEDVARSIENLIYMMPCQTCRNHFKHFLQDNPVVEYIHADTMYGAFKWTVDLHNSVNRQLEKPEVSFEDALQIWQD